ncbi:putative F-box protein At1g44080 [Carex rostrata]
MAPKRKRINLTGGSWSQLQIDIVDNIMKRLDLPVDVVFFSAVCKPWRYVALGFHMSLYCKLPMHHFVPNKSPLPMLLHPGSDGPNTHQFYSLNQRKKYGRFRFNLPELSNKWIVGSGAGWLVTVDTIDADPQINLLNPLTGKKIPLPHLSTVPSYEIANLEDDPTAYWYIRKVIVCSYQGSFLIVALVSDSKTIRFCRIGDSKWTRLEISPLFLHDIIMHNSKLYAINYMGAVFEIDIAGPAKVTMVAEPGYRPVAKYFLVDLCGELVVVAREQWRSIRKSTSARTSGFEVFKLVENISGYFHRYESEAGMQYAKNVRHSCVLLENLGHHMVFIGYNHSLSLDSRVYPRCKGNCIYFADYRHNDDDDIYKMRGKEKDLYHDVGVYRMKHQKVRYFKNLCDASSPMNMVWLSPNFSTELEMQMIPQ